MKQALLTLSLAGALMFPAGAALADHHMKSPEDKQEKMEAMYKAIGASDTQKQQLNSLHQQYHAQKKPLMDSLWDRKKALKLYLLSPQANQTEAIRMESEIIQLKTQLGRLHIDHAFQKRALLNAEQLQKAYAFKQQKINEMTEKYTDKHDEMDD
jgi:Spy/CpxP family protein refolding chaperone